MTLCGDSWVHVYVKSRWPLRLHITTHDGINFAPEIGGSRHTCIHIWSVHMSVCTQKITLTIHFEHLVLGHSYSKGVMLVTRPVFWFYVAAEQGQQGHYFDTRVTLLPHRDKKTFLFRIAVFRKHILIKRNVSFFIFPFQFTSEHC